VLAAKLFRDYGSAIRAASRRGDIGGLRAVFNVFLARMAYGVGPFYHSVFQMDRFPERVWSDFVVSKEFNEITRIINGEKNYRLARDKIIFINHCLQNGISTVSPLGLLVRKSDDRRGDVICVSTEREFGQLLQACPDQLFFKIVDGAHGERAFRATRGLAGTWFVEGRALRTEELYGFAIARLGADTGWLIQPVVSVHDDLLPIMPGGALGTVRIVTYLTNDGAKPLRPIIRIPAGGNVTDNFSCGMSGNLVAAVDVDTGLLGLGKGSRQKVWPDLVDIAYHPDTGAAILGRLVPYWKETLELVIMAQEKTPALRTLGWDVAITNCGPVVLEANTLYGVEILQCAYGKPIRNELLPIFEMLDF